MTVQRNHRNVAHHHPSVHRVRGSWVWECGCGGASRRIPVRERTWREAVIEALLHSDALAP
ncbi:hypothetical protein GCM10023168_33140 [Fodinibacter luteus]|uniref:Uncharacterized protein n=1 Tax=Fodinibacter luteus TaxID=552064 RepID=A0ABP8KNQ7_9MICO